MERKSHINERLRTEFANSGRAAGIGTLYDDYGDESGNPHYGPLKAGVQMPSDSLTPEERKALNGEVRIIKEAKNHAQR